jgi:hypothetical protein
LDQGATSEVTKMMGAPLCAGGGGGGGGVGVGAGVGDAVVVLFFRRSLVRLLLASFGDERVRVVVRRARHGDRRDGREDGRVALGGGDERGGLEVVVQVPRR